jgi:hypothetical protein
MREICKFGSDGGESLNRLSLLYLKIARSSAARSWAAIFAPLRPKTGDDRQDAHSQSVWV